MMELILAIALRQCSRWRSGFSVNNAKRPLSDALFISKAFAKDVYTVPNIVAVFVLAHVAVRIE